MQKGKRSWTHHCIAPDSLLYSLGFLIQSCESWGLLSFRSLVQFFGGCAWAELLPGKPLLQSLGIECALKQMQDGGFHHCIWTSPLHCFDGGQGMWHVWKSFLFPFINSRFGVKLFICTLLSNKDCRWNNWLWNGSSLNQMLMDTSWSLELSGSSTLLSVIILLCEMQGSPRYGTELGMREVCFLSRDPFLVILTKVSPSAIVEQWFFLILWSTWSPGVEWLVLQILPYDERRW